MKLNTSYVLSQLETYLRGQGFTTFVFSSYSDIDPTKLPKPCIVITPDTSSVEHQVHYIVVEDNIVLYVITETNEEKIDFVSSVVSSLVDLVLEDNPLEEFQFNRLEIPEIQWDVQTETGLPLSAISLRVRHYSP